MLTDESIGVWRMEERAFMGVVYAISREQEKKQRLERGELLGETYMHCKRLLPGFDPASCSTFARYCYIHLGLSLPRDVARERRSNLGLKHDGTERKPRAAPKQYTEPAEVIELPGWWPMLSAKQKSIGLLLIQGVRLKKIAVYMDTDKRGILDEIELMRKTLLINHVPGAENVMREDTDDEE